MTASSSWDSEYATGNYKHWEPDTSSPELAALIAAGFLGRGAKVLDAGCGGGLDAIFMAQQGLKVLGVDSSRKSLRIAKKRAARAQVGVEWLAADVFNLPFVKEAVDFITDRGLFHVIEDIDRPKYSGEVFRVLKPLGSIVIRGASEKVGRDRFNPVTEAAINSFFPTRLWIRGEVVLFPLFSPAGKMDARIAVLKKKGSSKP